MGCASSKQQQPVCQNCKAPCPPVYRKSFSVLTHHAYEGDHDHLVSLTSSTLGSLKLDPFYQNHRRSEASAAIFSGDNKSKFNVCDDDYKNFSIEVIEAKTWSRMIEEKISKVNPITPVRTPPGEPEAIDASELMAGLEDCSPVPLHRHTRSFSFNFASRTKALQIEPGFIENGGSLWADIAENDSNSNSSSTSIISDFDPDVIDAFRKSLEALPPADPFDFNSLINEKKQALAGKDEPLDLTEANKSNGYKIPKIPNKDKVIVYFTSLRGVRKTYEDCCYIRVILKGLGFRLDERDVSMHSGFKEELKELLGDGFVTVGLPRVFLGKKLIGGVDEIRRMHEAGQLEKVFECCEIITGADSRSGKICEGCGDTRFMVCEICSGSCKVYQENQENQENEYDDNEDEFDEGEFGFQRCTKCNENGLIRCRVCCD